VTGRWPGDCQLDSTTLKRRLSARGRPVRRIDGPERSGHRPDHLVVLSACRGAPRAVCLHLADVRCIAATRSTARSPAGIVVPASANRNHHCVAPDQVAVAPGRWRPSSPATSAAPQRRGPPASASHRQWLARRLSRPDGV
jgi:hypothetical protein